MDGLPEVLERASRCVLAVAGGNAPLLSPMAFWADGAALWLSTPAASVKAEVLQTRPSCSVYVADPDQPDAGMVVTGRARVYGLHDPIALAVHGPVVSAAMAALAGRNTGSLLGYLQEAPNVPRRFRPHNRVAVRIRIDEVAPTSRPAAGHGIAPALPVEVPPQIRRLLAGQRAVVAATQESGGDVVVGPAVWGEGYRLQLAEGRAPASGARCALHVGAKQRNRPTGETGVCLTGEFHQGRFTPRRVTWWEGFNLDSADVRPPSSSLVLPD